MHQLKDFHRKPSKAERVVAIFLSGFLTLFFGLVAVLFGYLGEYSAAVVSWVLFLVSGVIFFRALRTNSKALSQTQTRIAGWCLFVVGGAAITASIAVKAPLTTRLQLLVPALSILAMGVAGIRWRRDNA